MCDAQAPSLACATACACFASGEDDHERLLPDTVVDLFARVRHLCGVNSRPLFPSEAPGLTFQQRCVLAREEARAILREACALNDDAAAP